MKKIVLILSIIGALFAQIKKDGDYLIVNQPNLTVGRTGIIVRKYKSNDEIIIANATVIRSGNQTSVLKQLPFKSLEQNAIVDIKPNVKKDDNFIPNYLEDVAILIAPNIESFLSVRKEFKQYTFLHSDLFAYYLRKVKKPVPTKEDFINFAIKNDVGTIVIVINKKIYILDARTFNVVRVYNTKNIFKEAKTPFYTRVNKIEKSFFSFGDDEIKDYNNYYTNLVEAKDD